MNEELLEVQCGQLCKLKTPKGAPKFYEIYHQGLDQVLKVNIGEKSSYASVRKWEKGTIFEMHQSPLFFLTSPALRRN